MVVEWNDATPSLVPMLNGTVTHWAWGMAVDRASPLGAGGAETSPGALSLIGSAVFATWRRSRLSRCPSHSATLTMRGVMPSECRLMDMALTVLAISAGLTPS